MAETTMEFFINLRDALRLELQAVNSVAGDFILEYLKGERGAEDHLVLDAQCNEIRDRIQALNRIIVNMGKGSIKSGKDHVKNIQK